MVFTCIVAIPTTIRIQKFIITGTIKFYNYSTTKILYKREGNKNEHNRNTNRHC